MVCTVHAKFADNRLHCSWHLTHRIVSGSLAIAIAFTGYSIYLYLPIFLALFFILFVHLITSQTFIHWHNPVCAMPSERSIGWRSICLHCRRETILLCLRRLFCNIGIKMFLHCYSYCGICRYSIWLCYVTFACYSLCCEETVCTAVVDLL